MFIKSLTLENWKCFADELSLEFSTIEIFSFPNGSGKTSVLEAIYYGLWGKTDAKLSSYKNNTENETKVTVAFTFDDEDFLIKREMDKNQALLYKNGELFKHGIKEVYDYMNSLLPYTLVKRLWFKGDIADTQVLDFKFFKDEILSEQLNEAQRLHKYYSSEQRSKSKQAKEIVVRNDFRKIDEIEKDIEKVSSKLKDKSNASDGEYTKALQVKKDIEEFNALKSSYTPKSKEDIFKWKQLNLSSLEQELSKEQAKIKDDFLSKINANALTQIVKSNNEENCCVVCKGEWKQERKDYIASVIAKGLLDSTRIEKIKEAIQFKNSIEEKDIVLSEKFYTLEQNSKRMPNYKEVIDSYDKENNLLWEQFEALSREKENAIKNNQNADLVAKLLNDVEQCKARVKFLKDYMDKATAYYTSALLDKANAMLHTINNNYDELSVSPEDNSIQVEVNGSKLLVSQLSRGERTMVAMSLIYALRDIFTPSMPLIFDESFASLSQDNNYAVIRIVRASEEQIFIVSHSQQWTTQVYDETKTNIRMEW